VCLAVLGVLRARSALRIDPQSGHFFGRLNAAFVAGVEAFLDRPQDLMVLGVPRGARRPPGGGPALRINPQW
jgi:hypothetical protein